jgi:orotidine-5'-phosphate decarboxylase
MGRYKPKGSKRIVSSAVKEVSPVTSMIPTLKTAMISENVFHPEVAVAKNNTSLKDEEAERAEIRKKAGLTYEQLCETVAKGLMAMVCNAETGEPICPANSERAKFVAAAIDLLGAKKAEQGAQKIPSIIIVLPTGERLI